MTEASKLNAPEPAVLGQPVRLLSDERLEAASALKTEAAADAIAGIQRAVGAALEAVSLAEVLRYERERRDRAPIDDASRLLNMVAAHLQHGRKLGGLSREQKAAVLRWHEVEQERRK